MSLRTTIGSLLPDPVVRSLRPVYERVGKAGWRFKCPVCERRVPRFEPLNPYYREQWRQHGYRPVAERDETCDFEAHSCPFCKSPDRDRLYALFLREKLAGAGPGFTLVDFAPAPALRDHICRNYRIAYRTADLSMAGVDDRVDIAKMDLYPEGTFDGFVCSHVLEHVPDDRRAMAELCRILKPGGWGIAMVPIPLGFDGVVEDPAKTTEAERWRCFGQGDHVRIYSRRVFVERLKGAGFEVRALDRLHFGPRAFRRNGIGARSVLYVVEKPILGLVP